MTDVSAAFLTETSQPCISVIAVAGFVNGIRYRTGKRDGSSGCLLFHIAVVFCAGR
jgi:hypothetical protein